MKNRKYDKLLKKQSDTLSYEGLNYRPFSNIITCYTCNAIVVLKVPLFDYSKNTVLNVQMVRSTHRLKSGTSFGTYTRIGAPFFYPYAFHRRQLRRRIRIITNGRWKREE